MYCILFSTMNIINSFNCVCKAALSEGHQCPTININWWGGEGDTNFTPPHQYFDFFFSSVFVIGIRGKNNKRKR